MSETNLAGEARTDEDAPANKKTDARVTDGGSKREMPLAGFRRDILIVLANTGATHGRAIADDLESFRSEKVNDGRFYPNLNALVDAGLVEKRENEHDKRSHEYALSERGQETIREHAQRIAGALEAIDGGAR